MKKIRSEPNDATNAMMKYVKPISMGPEPSHRVMMLAMLASTPPKACDPKPPTAQLLTNGINAAINYYTASPEN